MPKISLRILCLVTAVLCNVQRSLEREIPRRSFLSRRAIDGTRGRKYFDPNEEGAFDSYGSAGGQYDPYDYVTDLSDIRKNVPGEPGVDYPAYTTLPQTGFTCEGRSRGYYADEAAGCQVFHVCHDVLVSSFLCPIGSTFSQKLLTCDWWTKVDCSTTGRYLEVNRNSYQIDDDEMIRNAYAMISLQSAEDVTKDGLVDPDSGTRIIDYSALGGRTMVYTPGFHRIVSYFPVDATGNDLPNGFEDYLHQHDRQVSNYDRYRQKTKTSSEYQNKFHVKGKGQSPYHASPIIRHDYQDRSDEFHDNYRTSDGFTNQLQTSYAPTVPTVTTTTRRLYSPTVPTTYRPSTLAYNKLDLLMDSSDHLYAHSKSLTDLTTPPTIVRQYDDSRNVDAAETRRDDSMKSDSTSSPGTAKDNRGNVRSKIDEEKVETSFRINVTDAIDEDEVFRQQNDRPVIRDDSGESSEDIETKDSIGIAAALNNPPVRQSQDHRVDRVLKDGLKGPTTPVSSRTNPIAELNDKKNANLTRIPNEDVFVINESVNDRSTEAYDDIVNSTERNVEETATRTYGDNTTPLSNRRSWQERDDDSVQKPIVSVTVKPVISASSVDKIYGESIDRSSSNGSRIIVDQNSSSTRSFASFNDGSLLSQSNLGFVIPQPAQFLKPPRENFLINVPEEIRYTTIDETSRTSWNPVITTTEIPRFSAALSENNRHEFPVYSGNVESLIDYTDEVSSETPNSKDHSTHRVIGGISTSIPWHFSTWHDQSIVNIPATDIAPPIVDYNDGFGDFVPPDEDTNGHSRAAEFHRTDNAELSRTQNSPTTKNDSETGIMSRYNTRFQFRDGIENQFEPKVNTKSPCSVKQTRNCELTFNSPKIVISEETMSSRSSISADGKGTTKIPEQLISLDIVKSIEKPVTSLPSESSTSTTRSLIAIGSNVEGSTLRTILSRNLPRNKGAEEKTEKGMDVTTVNSLLHSIRPESIKKIDETIEPHISPYRVSLAEKKENSKTTDDYSVDGSIAQRKQPTSVSRGQSDNLEIFKPIEREDEVASISRTPKLPDTSYKPLRNNSPLIELNDTSDQIKELDSNVSMLNLLQLMAELLKLDRLPRPFSAEDLRNVELESSLNLGLDESSSVTSNPLFDHSPETRTLGNVNSDFVEPGRSANLDKLSFVATIFDRERARASLENANSKVLPFDDISKMSSNVAFEPPPVDISSRINFGHAMKPKEPSQSKLESGTTRPLQKQEILEQLKENFGQPLYRGDVIQEPPVFDLPQVQKNFDFKIGPPTEENESVKSKSEKDDTASATTTMKTTTRETTITTIATESEKTVVETEFVPSIGFSFDTNEDREQYVEAVLEGLIDYHDGSRNESSVTRLTDDSAEKSETLKPPSDNKHKGSKDI